MYLPNAVSFLLFLGVAVNALEAVYAPEGDQSSGELLLQATQKFGINVNILLDQIIESARKALILAKEETLSLPDFAEDIYKKIWLVTIHGHLQCTKGSLRSLASVRRSGDAMLEYKDTKLMVVAPLSLEELVVNYDYDASILHMGATGGLTANVTSNSVRLVVEVSVSTEGCKFKMEEAQITDLGPIHVNLTGLYPFDGLSAAIAEKAVDSLHETIRTSTEQVLQKRLQKIIDKIPCHLPAVKKTG